MNQQPDLLRSLAIAILLLAGACNTMPNEPPAPRLLRFAVMGDTQGQHLLSTLVEGVNRHGAEYLVIPGDLVSTGSVDAKQHGSWQSWIQQAAAFKPGLDRILMTPGNHDLPSGGDQRWRDTFANTPDGGTWLPDSPTVNGKRGLDQMDYFVDVGNARFISLTTDTQKYGAQTLANKTLSWLLEVLRVTEEAEAIQHVFIFTHHPVTFDSFAPTIAGTVGKLWQGIITESTKTHALFTGHWHLFQPSRPDANRPETWEVVTGTGGGGLEGRMQQSHHGFLIVDIFADGNVQADFISDLDGATNGWSFVDPLDSFTLHNPNALPQSPLVASYDFEHGRVLLDTARGVGTKRVHGERYGDASSSDGVYGRALSLHGNGHAATAAIGDYELAIVTDLTLSIAMRMRTQLRDRSATLVEYSAPGPHPRAYSEAINTCYSLQIDHNRHLILAWESGLGKDHNVRSTTAADVEVGSWHRIRATRDHEARTVRFFVDGKQLGAAVSFTKSPSGGGAGFLHIGRSADTTKGFDGDLDELRICRIALDGQEFPPTLIRGDLNGDGALTETDLDLYRARFSPTNLDLDLDGDSRANEQDVAILMRGIERSEERHPSTVTQPLALEDSDSGLQLTHLGGIQGEQIYEFRGNQGLRIQGLSPERQEDYQLSMLVAFSSFGNGKWGKLVDYQNRKVDTGLYLREQNGQAVLEFFPNLGKATTSIERGRFHHIEVKRDRKTRIVEVVLDGVRQFKFVDSKNEAVFAGTYLLCDDRGAEAAAGMVHRLRLTSADQASSSWPTDLALPGATIDANQTLRIYNNMPSELRLDMLLLHTEGRSLQQSKTLSELGWCWVPIRDGVAALVADNGGTMSLQAKSQVAVGELGPNPSNALLPRIELILQGSALDARQQLPVEAAK